jgi:hypothetical protein
MGFKNDGDPLALLEYSGTYDSSNYSEESFDNSEEIIFFEKFHDDRVGCKVKFTKIQVNEFVIQVGDCPSVTDGPPIVLSSLLLKETILDVKKYERKRHKKRRQDYHDLVIPAYKREKMQVDMMLSQRTN